MLNTASTNKLGSTQKINIKSVPHGPHHHRRKRSFSQGNCNGAIEDPGHRSFRAIRPHIYTHVAHIYRPNDTVKRG